jgi:hypothetical protein
LNRILRRLGLQTDGPVAAKLTRLKVHLGIVSESISPGRDNETNKLALLSGRYLAG